MKKDATESKKIHDALNNLVEGYIDDIENNDSNDEVENLKSLKSDEIYGLFHKLKNFVKISCPNILMNLYKLENKIYEEINGKDKILRYFSPE